MKQLLIDFLALSGLAGLMFVAFSVFGAVPPETKEPPLALGASDLEGIWSVEGGDDQHGCYEGIAIIQRTSPAAFRVLFFTGPNPVVGIGLHRRNTLAVAWQTGLKDVPLVGVTIYEIDGRTMEGKWTSGKGVHEETLRWIRKVPFKLPEAE